MAAFGADDLAHLEEERRFLLRSLDDLDREHAAGDVDDADYRQLRDGYVKRAAVVLDEIERGRATFAERPRSSWRRRLLGVAAVVAVAVGVGVIAAQFSGQRLSSDSMTGDVVGRNRVASLLAEARALLNADDVDSLLGAGQLFEQVLDEDPGNPEALTYGGWVAYVLSLNDGLSAEVREAALVKARTHLEAAIEADPSYPDPLCFRAIVAANADADVEAARDFAERCMALDPPAMFATMMDPFIERLDTWAASMTTLADPAVTTVAVTTA